jgi:hypothetical protein
VLCCRAALIERDVSKLTGKLFVHPRKRSAVQLHFQNNAEDAIVLLKSPEELSAQMKQLCDTSRAASWQLGESVLHFIKNFQKRTYVEAASTAASAEPVCDVSVDLYRHADGLPCVQKRFIPRATGNAWKDSLAAEQEASDRVVAEYADGVVSSVDPTALQMPYFPVMLETACDQIGPAGDAFVARMALSIVYALVALHSVDYAHCDVKPDNIGLECAALGDDVAVLLDLGSVTKLNNSTQAFMNKWCMQQHATTT